MIKNILAISLTLFMLTGFYGCHTKNKIQEVNKPALMWFDATANFSLLSHTDSIDYYLEKVKSIGFTHAIVDIRPISGEVLYDSKLAPRMTEWKGAVRDSSFDFLGYFIRKGHELGLEVHASLNVFVAGHNFHDRGQIYSGKPEWASMVYTPDQGIVPITSLKSKYSAMVNPINPDFRQHILDLLKEVTAMYPDLDGLILDRVRYDGIMADFSELSRHQFEEYMGEKLENFPEDIYAWKTNSNGSADYVPGKHFKKWLEWRAGNIYDFMDVARKEVKSVNPKISFGTYTGAWYPSYYETGVNWASSQYNPSMDYDWASPDYMKTGYAELLDLFTIGNYYTQVTIREYLEENKVVKNETDYRGAAGTWYCVEGSCKNVRGIMNGLPFIGGILVDQFYNNPHQLSRTIAMNLLDSDGLMVFDICHIIEKNLWKEVEEGFKMAAQNIRP
ncbi:MAG: alpha amylase family protein [Bacteroidota bacterium]